MPVFGSSFGSAAAKGKEDQEQQLPSFWRWSAWGIIAAWLLLAFPLFFFSPKLIGETHLGVKPPSGSSSLQGRELEFQYFTPTALAGKIFVLMRSTDGHITDPKISSRLRMYSHDVEKVFPRGHCNHTITGYFLASDEDPLRLQYVSSNNRSALTVITGYGCNHTTLQTFIRTMRAEYLDPSAYGLPKSVSFHMTGQDVLNMDGQDGTAKDIGRMEQICLPVAFLVFCYYLRSIKILFIPLVNIILSIALSFAVCYPIATQMRFFTITPSIMLSLAMALSIDYSLFILVRFKESSSVFEGLVEIKKHTIKTILASGGLIAVAVLWLVAIPCGPIRGVGIGAGVTAISTMLVNLTVTPAILCICGSWLRRDSISPETWQRVANGCSSLCPWKRRGATSAAVAAAVGQTDDASEVEMITVRGDEGIVPVECAFAAEELEGDGSDDLACATAAETPSIPERTWQRLGKWISKSPTVVILLVLVLGAPFYCRIPEVRVDTLDQMELLPRGSASIKDLRIMEEDFPAGMISPFLLLVTDLKAVEDQPTVFVDANRNNYTILDTKLSLAESGLFSDRGFKVMAAACEALEGVAGFPLQPSNFDGVIYFPDGQGDKIRLSFEQVEKKLADPISSRFYQASLEEGLSHPNHKHGLIKVSTPFPSSGSKASKWVLKARDVIEELNTKYEGEIRFILFGGSMGAFDFSQTVKDALPSMLGYVIVSVALLVLFMFRSLLIPIRLALTLIYTLAVCFGITFYVYQTKAFYWLFPYLKDFEGDAIQWMVPSLSITVMIALGLDYDIFLLSRVVEIRFSSPCTDDAAIVEALGKTGSVISGAGVIMSVAFFGLVISDVIVLNQFGILLCSSALLDTFVVRTLLLPAVMLVAGKWNWWPRQPPTLLSPPNDTLGSSPNPSVDSIAIAG